MLILTRHEGQSIMIGEDIVITILGFKGTQVRVGITAPKDVPAHREEIFWKIKQERKG